MVMALAYRRKVVVNGFIFSTLHFFSQYSFAPFPLSRTLMLVDSPNVVKFLSCSNVVL